MRNLTKISIGLAIFAITFFGSRVFASTLIIGDSHACGAFGKDLSDSLVTRQNRDALIDTVDKYCVVGTAPAYWLPKVPAYLKKPYSRVVVVLGTNSLLGLPDASYSKLAAMFDAQRCYWVSPPHLKPSQAKGFPVSRLQKMENNLQTFKAALIKAVPQCTVIDSGPYTQGNTVDGVHRAGADALKWAQGVLFNIH